jgi:opacity protein-like surface antigen
LDLFKVSIEKNCSKFYKELINNKKIKMKKNILKTFGFGLSACLIAGSAQAVELKNFYMGASYLAEVDHDDRARTLPGNRAPFTGDQKDQGYGLFVGYQFHKNFGLELSYKDLGESQNNTTYNDGKTLRATNERQHGSLDLVANAEIAKDFKVFAKVGYGAIYSEQTGVDNSTENGVGRQGKIGESESEQGANYGIGAQYNFGKLFVRAEYEQLPEIGSRTKDTGTALAEPKVYSISIGTSF